MKSSAFIVGAERARGNELSVRAEQTGFAHVAAFTGMAGVEAMLARQPLAFFLFSPVPDIAQLSGIVKPLRSCKRRDVRFMPLIYFCEVASREVIRGCMALGFDDVVALPVTADSLRTRLQRQVDTPQLYRADSGYFGPARNRAAGAGEDGHNDTRFVRSAHDGIVLWASGSDAA